MESRPITGGINRDEWLKALGEAGVSFTDDQAALTLMEFAAMIGVPRTTAQYQLTKLVTAGKAVLTQKRGPNTAGRVITQRAYRLLS
jgi:hypothetical protein